MLLLSCVRRDTGRARHLLLFVAQDCMAADTAKRRKGAQSAVDDSGTAATDVLVPISEDTLHAWDLEWGSRANETRATENSFVRGVANAHASLLDTAAGAQAIMSATGMPLTRPVAAGMIASDDPSSTEQLIGASVEMHKAMTLHTVEVLAGRTVPVVGTNHRGYASRSDIPTAWPWHHEKFLRRVNPANPHGYVERLCCRAADNLCEAMHFYPDAYCGLREYLTEPEEKALVKSGGKDYPTRPPLCLLCWRSSEAMIVYARRSVQSGFQMTAARQWKDATGTPITEDATKNVVVPINHEQPATGMPGAYSREAIIASRDGGDSETGFIAGGVLAYEPRHYYLRPDGTISQDAIVFQPRPIGTTSQDTSASDPRALFE